MKRAICKSNKFLTSVPLVRVDRVTGEARIDSDRTFASQLHLLINHAFERFRLKSPTGDRTQVNVNPYTVVIMGSREVRCLRRATLTQK
ncbi:hypothetical protein [Nostoc sp.]|uniref:hypothetical protein n=1 Tax=Nostoc sp. TaxID=1180 RepID=UPI002FF7FC72